MIKYIRNFCIIAHIDHGKSTLVNSFLKITKQINILEKKILLDNMFLEKKRGITIKSKTIQLEYIYKNKIYYLNIIDTPGHIDFINEVLKSLYSCEGVLLLIDCSQNIQAQTINNYLLAKKNNLYIIPVINKIDLKVNNLYIVENDVLNLLKCDKKDILYISAKKNLGIKKLIIEIIKRIPYPKGNKNKKLEILVLNFIYKKYKKILIYCKIINGKVYKNKYVNFLNVNFKNKIIEVGIVKYNKRIIKPILIAGEVGYIIFYFKVNNLKFINNVLVEDNKIHLNKNFLKLLNYKPFVYVNIFSKTTNNLILNKCLNLLSMEDNAFSFKKYNSSLLGLGFKCGFLGMLHMEIILKRLEIEYNQKIFITNPSVIYKLILKNKKIIYLDSFDEIPKKNLIKYYYEPFVFINIITYNKYIGKIINFCINKRAKFLSQKNLLNDQINLKFIIPLYEIIYNFYNNLKSLTNGYLNLDYSIFKYKKTNLVGIKFLINKNYIKSFNLIIDKFNSLKVAKYFSDKLLNFINRKQSLIKINVEVDNKIIFKNIIRPFRKNVISKCYGGDITRKKKLLKKQKIGKNKSFTNVNIKFSKKIFLKLLNVNL
ncbi:MAG: translation elongation factor 4 [Candidatus Shikimatogenerans sp. AspAUS03]|uniref:Tetracycline resistance protein TetQ n=1 Tax=Candidatus Shikimatogenerans sp. AspAUS03 TaxID=3158563 RepID=A0AAU7QSC5_9FLAO